jgi:U3 small nucleolar ribonucleoprotein protein IMP3
MRRYHIQERDDYKKYQRLCGLVTKLTAQMKHLDATDKLRIDLTDQLLDKCVDKSAI